MSDPHDKHEPVDRTRGLIAGTACLVIILTSVASNAFDGSK
jgi:hypothetical protein